MSRMGNEKKPRRDPTSSREYLVLAAVGLVVAFALQPVVGAAITVLAVFGIAWNLLKDR